MKQFQRWIISFYDYFSIDFWIDESFYLIGDTDWTFVIKNRCSPTLLINFFLEILDRNKLMVKDFCKISYLLMIFIHIALLTDLITFFRDRFNQPFESLLELYQANFLGIVNNFHRVIWCEISEFIYREFRLNKMNLRLLSENDWKRWLNKMFYSSQYFHAGLTQKVIVNFAKVRNFFVLVRIAKLLT